MLSNKAVQEFREIWLNEYGQRINSKEAREKATRLIHLFKSIYLPRKIVSAIDLSTKT